MGALVGVIIGALAVLVSMIMEGGQPAALINIPAALIVFGGTFGVLVASFSMKEALSVIKLVTGVAMKERKDTRAEMIQTLVGFSEKARREGLLVLEDDARRLEDPFLRKGIQLVVDGTDPELVKDILETDLEAMEARHRRNHEIFKQAGGFAPTLGIIGTVLGLVHVLENLSNPSTLGPAISGAFLATFFGVFSANIFWLPVMNALKKRTGQEVDERVLMIEGVLSIQSGDNPRILAEKLRSFLPPDQREGADEAEGGAAAGGAGADEAMKEAA